MRRSKRKSFLDICDDAEDYSFGMTYKLATAGFEDKQAPGLHGAFAPEEDIKSPLKGQSTMYNTRIVRQRRRLLSW